MLFFAAYLNMLEKIFIQYSGVVFLSGYFCRHYSNINFSSGVWTNIPQAVGPGSNLSGHKFSQFQWHLSELSTVPMAQWVGQQGSEALGTGSNPSLYPHFSILLIRRKIVTPIPPPIMHEIFRYQKFSETEEFSYEMFWYCETRIFQRKSWYPIAWNFSIPEIFWYTEEFLYEIFQYCETKNCRQKILISPSYA